MAAPTIKDTTVNPIIVPSGGTTNPFVNVEVQGAFERTWDSFYGAGGDLKITLTSPSGLSNLGTLSDPNHVLGSSGYNYDVATNTFTEHTYGGPHIGALPYVSNAVHGLLYTAPTLASGQTLTVQATISFTEVQWDGKDQYPVPTHGVPVTVTDPTPVTLHVASPAIIDTPTLTPPPPPAAPPPAVEQPVAALPPAAPPPAVAPPVVEQPGGSAGGGNFIIANQTTGQQSMAAGVAYNGPVSRLEREFILVTPDNVNITAQVPNVFIHSGSGTGVLDVSKSNGNNVLDGGSGSNFLTGGTGFDTFFLDYRNPTVDLFSTIVNFHSGDNLTIFGINQTDYMLKLLDNQGAANAKGLDFAVDAAGKPHGNVVLAGFSNADIASGKLTLSYGRTQDLPGLPGSEYLNIHGN